MVWVSGPRTSCSVCQGELALVSERFDQVDNIFVGALICRKCGESHLDTRRADQPRAGVEQKGSSRAMFKSRDLKCQFKRAALKMVSDPKGVDHRVCEATLVIEPLPRSLALELGADVAGHLFDEKQMMRGEVDNIMLHINAGLQRVTVKSHFELDAIAMLEPVEIDSLKATRIDDEKNGKSWFSLAFVLIFELSDKAARSFTIDHFGNPVYLTFNKLQRDLPLGTPDKKAAPTPTKHAAKNSAKTRRDAASL